LLKLNDDDDDDDDLFFLSLPAYIREVLNEEAAIRGGAELSLLPPTSTDGR